MTWNIIIISDISVEVYNCSMVVFFTYECYTYTAQIIPHSTCSIVGLYAFFLKIRVLNRPF